MSLFGALIAFGPELLLLDDARRASGDHVRAGCVVPLGALELLAHAGPPSPESLRARVARARLGGGRTGRHRPPVLQYPRSRDDDLRGPRREHRGSLSAHAVSSGTARLRHGPEPGVAGAHHRRDGRAATLCRGESRRGARARARQPRCHGGALERPKRQTARERSSSGVCCSPRRPRWASWRWGRRW